jgi:hypothetical protein
VLVAVSAATLARCLDFTDAPREALGWASRAQVADELRSNPFTADMAPYRVHNRFFVYWVAASVVLVDDGRVVLRVLARDRRAAVSVRVDPPGGRVLAVDVPPLSTQLAARHVGRRLVLCGWDGVPVEITVTGVDGDYVHGTRRVGPHTRALALHQAGYALLRGARHRITYSAGSQQVRDGDRSYDLHGCEIVRTGYFWNAWCSCGQWRYSDSAGADGRRYAVRAHLREVGALEDRATGL